MRFAAHWEAIFEDIRSNESFINDTLQFASMIFILFFNFFFFSFLTTIILDQKLDKIAIVDLMQALKINSSLKTINIGGKFSDFYFLFV